MCYYDTVLKAQFDKKEKRKKMKITLKAARVNANMTQEYVAEKLKKSKNTIVSYEKGRSTPDIETGKALAKLYGVSIDDLIFLPNNCALSTEEESDSNKNI
jgi:transcriptional regulator with XRE-family HTH domain